MTGVYKQTFRSGEGRWEWGHLQSELLTKFCDPKMESMYGFYFLSDPCGMQSPELRAEKGRERNGKVIRKGGWTSYVDEGSRTLRAQSKFCFVSPASPGRSWQAPFCSE